MPNTTYFRLRRIQISGHPVLKDVDITLCDDANQADSFYTTGIIGPNGTGKSHMMSAIATTFSEIRKAKDLKKTNRRFSFTVQYDYLGDSYCVSNSKRIGQFRVIDIVGFNNEALYATKNGHEINLGDIILPERVIASTMTVTDKFVAKSDSFYRYKGIRNERSASMTGTRTIIRKTVESLMDCMSSKTAFHEELRILLKNLGLEEHLYVSYGMRYKDLFLRPSINADGIRDIFDNWVERFPGRNNPPWGFSNYERGLKNDNEALEYAARFLSDKASGRSGDAAIARYDLMQNAQEFQRDAPALRALTQLDLVSFPSINVVKKGTAFELSDSSSGETHLLCQFIGIMADIRSGSLILIDEPENSSHPEWQMNYVGWLRDIFKNYRDCHFVIATHSPLILSNMKASESTIVRLKRDNTNRILDEGGMERGCYSWTVDEILQDVMEMKSIRTVDFNDAMTAFENALDNDDKARAKASYEKLCGLIKPGSELLELLRIQMIGLND